LSIVRSKFVAFAQVFFRNILKRDHANPDPKPSCKPGIWIAGFPCKAFSWLRCGDTRLLEDKEALVFHECIETLKAHGESKSVCTNLLSCVSFGPTTYQPFGLDFPQKQRPTPPE
jgi:hypothetical protein